MELPNVMAHQASISVICTAERDEHLENAYAPMAETFLGMLISVIPEPENA